MYGVMSLWGKRQALQGNAALRLNSHGRFNLLSETLFVPDTKAPEAVTRKKVLVCLWLWFLLSSCVSTGTKAESVPASACVSSVAGNLHHCVVWKWGWSRDCQSHSNRYPEIGRREQREGGTFNKYKDCLLIPNSSKRQRSVNSKGFSTLMFSCSLESAPI